MTARFLVLLAPLALASCKDEPGPRSLLGDFAAPGTYALAGDTLTVWKRVHEPDGAWRFHSYSITPGGTVEYLAELERVDVPEDPERRRDFTEHRQGFSLPPTEFETVRTQAALLRPVSLGPQHPVGGWGGEALPAGCAPDEAAPRIAGINFLNGGNWGAFVLQPGCASESAKAAADVMTRIFDRLERAARDAGQPHG